MGRFPSIRVSRKTLSQRHGRIATLKVESERKCVTRYALLASVLILAACAEETSQELFRRLIYGGQLTLPSDFKSVRAEGGMQAPYALLFSLPRKDTDQIIRANHLCAHMGYNTDDLKLTLGMLDNLFAKRANWWLDSHELSKLAIYGGTISLAGKVQTRLFFVDRVKDRTYVYAEQASETWIDLAKRSKLGCSTTGQHATK